MPPRRRDKDNSRKIVMSVRPADPGEPEAEDHGVVYEKERGQGDGAEHFNGGQADEAHVHRSCDAILWTFVVEAVAHRVELSDVEHGVHRRDEADENRGAGYDEVALPGKVY